MTDKDFLRYIYQNKHGLRADLVDEFDDRIVRQMEATGIILNAPSNKGTTWKMSKMAEEIASLKFKELSFSEKFMEWYYSHVRKISLSIG